MAKETTTRGVYPSNEAYTIEEYEGFGWQVESSQLTVNNAGETIVRLVFSRDKDMKNYSELRWKFDLYMEKEEEMKAIARQQDQMGEEPTKLQFNIITAIMSFIFGGVGFIFYIIAFSLKNKRIKREIAEYRKTYNLLQKKFENLDNECEQLLVEAKTLL
ncbi:MAG: hypothetical protein K2L70_05730 [Clostridia bacterium]|nr:hypothetical protein [Clostridia bacterium]